MDATFLPVDKLLDDFHPSIQLIECQNVLLSKETQSRALSKILPRTQRHKTSRELTPKCKKSKKQKELWIKIQKCGGFFDLYLCYFVDGSAAYFNSLFNVSPFLF